jgi:hypothetical protein
MRGIPSTGQGYLRGGIYQRWKLPALALAISPCLVTLIARDPAESGLFPPCPFLALTGLYCPGCGTLRSLHQLINGQLLAALDLNPLTALVLPFIGYALLSAALLSTTGRRLPGVFLPASWIWALLGAILVFWVLRNIPVYPLSLLAP